MERKNLCKDLIAVWVAVTALVCAVVDDYVKKNPSPRKAAWALCRVQIAKCGTSGFLAGLGGLMPTKAATDQYAYEFDAWSPALSPVKAAATYVTTYKASTREYSMSFDLGGGTVDGKSTYTVAAAYGSTITLPTPVREGYEFLYWEGSRYYGGDSYKVEGPHSFKAVSCNLKRRMGAFSLAR